MGIFLDAYTGLTYKLIRITSPTTAVTIQELVDTIRDWEDEVSNIQHRKVIDAVGKADVGGIQTAITLTLSSEWRIKFWSGVGVGKISGGNITGGYGGEVVEPTGGNDTIIVANQVGGVVVEEADMLSKITDIHKVELGRWKLDEQTNQMIFYDVDGETPLRVFDLKDKNGQPSSEDVYERVPV